MPYKHLPLNYIRVLRKHFPVLRKLGEDNKDLISFTEQTETQKWAFEYRDLEHEHGFRFIASNFEFREGDGYVFCSLEMMPVDPQNISVGKFKSRIGDITIHFKSWLDLVKEYNDLELTPEDKIRNYYEDLYYADFDILDDDAEDVPFDLERQLLIEQFAVLCLEILERNPEQNSDLIQDAIEIRDTVQSSTKKAIIKKISKFFAKAAQKSLPLLKEFASEAKKTIFKRMTEFGMQKIYEILHDGFHLLN